MKLKTENKILISGSILSFLIIYLTKIDTTPAREQWIYDMGQYLWSNLAISYLGSMIFYFIVIVIPTIRKRKLFFFQMAMDIINLHSLCLGFFFNLRNAANMQNEIRDTSEITFDQISKMIKMVNLETIHNFPNEQGNQSQSFKDYLEKLKQQINNAINNALAIPYDDAELSLLLLQLQRNNIISTNSKSKIENNFNEIDVKHFYLQLKMLNSYFNNRFYSILDTKQKPDNKKSKS